jgi:hypothetical protein
METPTLATEAPTLAMETPTLAAEYKPQTRGVREVQLSTPTLWEEGSSTMSFHPGLTPDLIIQVRVFFLKTARNKPTNCLQPATNHDQGGVLRGGASKTIGRGEPTHQ